MRTVKSSIKNFFAAIVCFLMNLIPGKKIWAMVENSLGGNVGSALKYVSCAGQVSHNSKNAVRNGNIVNLSLNDNSRYLTNYVDYLYEYIDYLKINDRRVNHDKNKVSFVKYEDTG